MGDYDDVADRISEYVPGDKKSQAQIRDYVDSNVELDPEGNIDKKDKLTDEISKRIAGDRDGYTPDDGDGGTDRYLWGPDDGNWRDEKGNFVSEPE